MKHEATRESLAHVLAAAGATKPQLHRWQREGLLPRPEQRGRGRGRGSTATYPAGSAKQAAAVRKALARHRSLDDARWRLWWEGWVIDEQRMRAALNADVRVVQDLQEAMRILPTLNDEQQDAAYQRLDDALAGRRVRDKLLKAIRRKSRGKFPGLVLLLLEIGSGRLREDRSQEETGDLLAAISPQATGASSLTARVSALFNAGAWRLALGHTTGEDLRQARDEVRVLFGAVGPWVDRLVVSAFGPWGAELLSLFRGSDITPYLQRFTLLNWLVWRTSESGQQLYAYVMRSVTSLQTGQSVQRVLDTPIDGA